jgi:enoyl-CoA hydratase/carnithine racemase
MLYTGVRIDGESALRHGLADVLVQRDQLHDAAQSLAREIAISSPIAVPSMRETLRAPLLGRLREAMARESAEQNAQFATEDFAEGVAAMTERRTPRFRGR